MDTQLPQKYFDPFDLVYRDVTNAILAHLAVKPVSSSIPSFWLRRLVDTFQLERDNWNGSPAIKDYRAHWLTLHTRMTRLSAGAFLHISYDLPRAMANDWPSSPNWPTLTEHDAEVAYQALTPIFLDSFERAAQRRSVVGLYYLILANIPLEMRGWFSHWVLLQREAAWRHARVLALQPGRALREAKLAQAMTDALGIVSDLRVYRISRLMPANLYSPTIVSIAAVPMVLGGWVMMLLIVILCASLWRMKRQMQRMERSRDADFLEIFAILVMEFTNKAVEDPDGYDAYAEQRRDEIIFGGHLKPRGAPEAT